MKRSEHRILTTHVGSLPRPPALRDLLVRQDRGEAVVENGLSLCSIHHRAFDQHLVGVSPDYRIRVSARLLEDDDGPMLELLKGFHGQSIQLPARTRWRPDRERLAERFERFLAGA